GLELRLGRLDTRLEAQSRALASARLQARTAVTELDLAARTRTATLASLRARADLSRSQIAQLDTLAVRAQRRSDRLSHAVAAGPTATAEPAPPSPQPRVAGGTRALVVDAVAYHLPGRTASGLPVGNGIVAVDPSVIPLGTRLFIPGYGVGVA